MDRGPAALCCCISQSLTGWPADQAPNLPGTFVMMQKMPAALSACLPPPPTPRPPLSIQV